MNINKIDALELLQSLDDKSVDLILTDPPYYKLLKVEWDNQWKTKDDYLNWLEQIIKECQRVLKDNGSFYMFCSPAMLIKVGGIVDKYFNILNTIRIPDRACRALLTSPDVIRRYINNSEEIIFAEQFVANDNFNVLYEPLKKYLNDARKKAKLTHKQINKLLGVSLKGGGLSPHLFGNAQWMLPTEEHYNILKQHMDIKPYEEIRQEYEELRRTFKLSSNKSYDDNSEEIIFAEKQGRDTEDNENIIYEPIVSYLNTQMKKARLTISKCNKILGKVGIASHYFTNRQHRPITEEAYNKLKQHMDLKPYDEIKKEYEELRRTFKLSSNKEIPSYRPYNNTWNFKQTKTCKGRHPCEKPEDLISYIIDVSSNENDLVVDMFCGSCIVPKCCETMNRRCIAGDVDDTYFPK